MLASWPACASSCPPVPEEPPIDGANYPEPWLLLCDEEKNLCIVYYVAVVFSPRFAPISSNFRPERINSCSERINQQQQQQQY